MAIKQGIKALDQPRKSPAARRMDKSIRAALAGQNIKDIEGI